MHAFAPLLARSLLLHSTPRTVLALSATLQHAAIAAACVVFYFAITLYDDSDVRWGLLMLLIALGMLAKLCLSLIRAALASMDEGQYPLVSRLEVVVAMAAPVLFGAVSTYREADVATVVVGGWSVAVMPFAWMAGCTGRGAQVGDEEERERGGRGKGGREGGDGEGGGGVDGAHAR